MKRKYFIQNKFGYVEEVQLENDDAAFLYAQNKNRRSNENWKAYNEHGNLIYRVAVCR